MDLKGKRLLITGADGFIGSHLVEYALQHDCEVRALAQYNSFNNWGWLEQIDSIAEVDVVTGDVRDSGNCESITKGIDVVFHLAALIAIPYSYRAPESYLDTNVKGSLYMSQACLKNNVERMVHFSTSEVYGSAQYVPIDEKHPVQPQSPYSASKIAADCVVESFYRSYDLPAVIARPFNAYGPRQSARAVIPSIISQLSDGRQNIEIGNMAPTRDFNYVKDTCRGAFMLAECDAAIGDTVNVGSNTEISIRDVLTKIAGLMGRNVQAIERSERIRPEKSEVSRLKCDNTKLRELTGYEPRYDLDAGLTQTIDWFSRKKNLSMYKTNIYNV